jgi:DME family drug/metabolite transporter
MRRVQSVTSVVLSLGLAGAVIVLAAHHDQLRAATPLAQAASAPAFTPPPDSAIPDNDFGKEVKLGQAIFNGASPLAAPFVDGHRVRGARRAALMALAGLVLVLAPWEPGRLAGHVALGALFGATSAVAYATNVFVVVRLAPAIGAARMLGLNGVIGAVALAPLALLAPSLHVSTSALALVALGGALPGTLAGWLFTRGVQVIGAARASVLAYIEPVVAVIVGSLFFAEPLSPWALLGGALILGGGVLVTMARAE